MLPLFAPIVSALGFGLDMTHEQPLLRFAMLVAVSPKTSFPIPPFSYLLFDDKGVAPPEDTLLRLAARMLVACVRNNDSVASSDCET